MLQLIVAEKLGKTLSELQKTVTYEEMVLWSAFYELRTEEEKKAMDRAKRNRR